MKKNDSLAGSKTNILAVAIDARLKEIQEVLDNDLIPSLFKLNGWEDEELPKFVYGGWYVDIFITWINIWIGYEN